MMMNVSLYGDFCHHWFKSVAEF